MRAVLIVLLAVVVAAAGWMLLSPMGDETGGVGVNVRVENDVTTASAGQDSWRPAVVGADVFFGDRIATASDSRLDVRLLDRSNLSVGANARLTIDRFVYDPSRNAVGAMVSVLTGAFRYASDQDKPEQVAFRTPGATIGIRGTVIEGVVGPEAVALIAGMADAPDLSMDADSAAVIILRSGAADVRAGGQTVVLDQPGQAVILTRKQVYPTFAVTPETTRRFEALLLPAASSAGSAPPPSGTPPPATTGPVRPPVTTAPSSATPPTRQPPRDPALRPQRPATSPTRPIGQGPLSPQRAGPVGPNPGPAGPNTGQPAPGGQVAPTGPQGTQPQAGQPQGARQPPARNQQGALTPPAGTTPGTTPAAAPSTTKPTDGSTQPQNGQTQPGQTQPNAERPSGERPAATPPTSRPTQPDGTRSTPNNQPQTQQPRQQPVAPGGGGAGPRRN